MSVWAELNAKETELVSSSPAYDKQIRSAVLYLLTEGYEKLEINSEEKGQEVYMYKPNPDILPLTEFFNYYPGQGEAGYKEYLQAQRVLIVNITGNV